MKRSETLDKFEEMFFDSVPYLERVAARYVGQEDAWHVLAGVWVDCARVAENKEIRSHKYLASAVRNRSLRHLESEKRHYHGEEQDGSDLIQETDDKLFVDVLLMSLDDNDRPVVLMIAEGMSKAEIADILGTTPHFVNKILQRVKNKLF